MSLEHKKYIRQCKIHSDAYQTVLTSLGIAQNPNSQTTLEPKIFINLNKKVTCPFCLGLVEFRLFLVSTKKGLSTSTVKCPLCQLTYRMKTLVNMDKWTPQKYAEWVYGYSHEGFWQKIKFNTWKNRLLLMGWTKEFWDTYKQLKGEYENAYPEKGYTDEENRKYQEYLDSQEVRS